MIEGWRQWLTVAAVIGTGTMGGVLFAFSTIAMSGLRAAPEGAGLRVMQAINTAANRSAGLFVALFGTAAACVALTVGSLPDLDGPGSVHLLVGSVLYLVGGLGVTVGFHIPRNEALDRVDPDAPGSDDAWRAYAGPWTVGNHVRTAACLAGTLAFALALRAT